ncbi:MAG: oligosaccharide flippase family protein [Thermoproteota archaeon]|nr:oligosaccharide flippase family protein [Thermoproteota archaeon]
MSNKPLHKITVGSYFLIIDQIINYGLGFVFWFSLAKLVAPEIVGQVLVVTASATAILAFAGYGSQITTSKYIAEYNAREMPTVSKKIFSMGLKTGLIVSASAAVIFLLLSHYLANSLYHDSSLTPLIIVAMAIFLPSQTILYCINGAFQGMQKMKYTAIADSVFQVAKILISVILIFLGFGSFGIILALALGSLVSVSIGLKLVRKLLADNPLKKQENLPNLRHVMRFSALNYLSLGMSLLGLQICYILLGSQENFSSVAVFGISAILSLIVGGVTESVGRAILPTTSEKREGGDEQDLSVAVNFAFRLSIVLSGFIYIVLLIAPAQVLSLLSKEYAAASQVLGILILAAIGGSLTAFLYFMLNGMGKPQWVAKISIISSSMEIGLAFLLIPYFGMQGAATALLIGTLAGDFLAIYYTRKLETLNMSYSNICMPLLTVASAISIGYATLILSSNNTSIALLLSIASYLLLIRAFKVASRSEVRELLQAVHKIIGVRAEQRG